MKIKEIDQKIQHKKRCIQVAIKRKTELMNGATNKSVNASRKEKKTRPVFSLEDLKVRSMLIE